MEKTKKKRSSRKTEKIKYCLNCPTNTVELRYGDPVCPVCGFDHSK